MEQAKFSAKEELRQEMWLENNPDFYDTLKHAEKFAEKSTNATFIFYFKNATMV